MGVSVSDLMAMSTYRDYTKPIFFFVSFIMVIMLSLASTLTLTFFNWNKFPGFHRTTYRFFGFEFFWIEFVLSEFALFMDFLSFFRPTIFFTFPADGWLRYIFTYIFTSPIAGLESSLFFKRTRFAFASQSIAIFIMTIEFGIRFVLLASGATFFYNIGGHFRLLYRRLCSESQKRLNRFCDSIILQDDRVLCKT